MELDHLDAKAKNIVENFIERLRAGLSSSLISVALYGSMARAEHSKKHSDINILIVLKDVNLEGLKTIAKIMKEYRARKISPLVLSGPYMENSTDTFPMEFLDMQGAYITLWGKDCLKGLKIDLANLRHQCEWELKSKIIRLQQFYIGSFGNDKSLRDFLIKNLPSFNIVFKNILRLKGITESDNDKVFERLALEFNLNRDIFDALWQARRANIKILKPQEFFGRFLSCLKELSDKLDTLS